MKALYIALSMSLLALSACDHKQPKVDTEQSNNPKEVESTPSPQPAKLKLHFHTSGESFYNDIQLDDGRLFITYFTDAEQRCAQWYKSQPCWTPADLETISMNLSSEQEQNLTKIIETSGLMQLEGERFGSKSLRERAYNEKLNVQWGNIERQFIYRSRPDAEPKPDALIQVENALRQSLPAKLGKTATR